MKNTILFVVCTMIGAASLVLVMTVYGRLSRSMELKSYFPSAVEEAVENVMINGLYEGNDNKEIIADFVQSLVYGIDSQTDLSIEIFGCDLQKGLFSVRAQEIYYHPNGRQGRAMCERMAIFEKYKTEEQKKKFRVEFFIGDECYKRYEICQGNVILAPVEPLYEDYIFYGWMNLDGTKADLSEPIMGDCTYYADLRKKTNN